MSRKFLKKVVTIKLGAFLPEKILLLVSDTMIRYIDRPVSNKLCAKVQGDPNQNLLFQLALSLNVGIPDPKLVKPKCV